MYEWLFFEQYSHEPYVATVRFWVKYAGKAAGEGAGDRRAHRPGPCRARGDGEGARRARRFLVGEQPTLADIALYAYTHVAPEGGFSLEGYPAIRSWLDRVTTVPGLRPDAVPRLTARGAARASRRRRCGLCGRGHPGGGSGSWSFPGSSSGWCSPSPGTARSPARATRWGWLPGALETELKRVERAAGAALFVREDGSTAAHRCRAQRDPHRRANGRGDGPGRAGAPPHAARARPSDSASTRPSLRQWLPTAAADLARKLENVTLELVTRKTEPGGRP